MKSRLILQYCNVRYDSIKVVGLAEGIHWLSENNPSANFCPKRPGRPHFLKIDLALRVRLGCDHPSIRVTRRLKPGMPSLGQLQLRPPCCRFDQKPNV